MQRPAGKLKDMNKKHSVGFTFAEVIIVVAITALLFVSSVGSYLFIKTALYNKFVEYNLIRDSNMMLKMIAAGVKEGALFHGLRSASGFTLANASDMSYVSTDNNTRRYFLNNNSLVYSSPAQWPNQRTVYTAPAGSAFTVRFWEPAGYSGHQTVGIYIGISRTVGPRTVSGAVSTYVNIRNLPK